MEKTYNLKQFAIQELRRTLTDSLHSEAQKTLEEDMGIMTGTMIVMVLNKYCDFFIKNVNEVKDELGITSKEIEDLVNQVRQEVIGQYISNDI